MGFGPLVALGAYILSNHNACLFMHNFGPRYRSAAGRVLAIRLVAGHPGSAQEARQVIDPVPCYGKNQEGEKEC